MKKILLLAVTVLTVASAAWSFELPQFGGTRFEGWTYNREDRELSTANINGNLITLFTTNAGNRYTLTSPEFSAVGLDSLSVTVTWRLTKDNPYFDLSRTALTVALVAADETTCDSVTCVPPTDAYTQRLVARLGRSAAWAPTMRLRLVAWDADEWSCGAVRKVEVAATTGGDVNNDGEVSIADVTSLVNAVLNDNKNLQYDVNHDGEVTIADVTSLINILLWL